MVKSEPKKKPQPGGFFQKFFRKPERNEKEQRLTVQRSIPYLEMGRDGICRVEEHLYSKTVRFYDINYQLAQNEDKNTIFESWCDFLNYFDASIRFQLSFINHKSDMSEYNKVIQIEPQHDAFDDVRMEYAQMLKQQLAKGNNGLVRTKYITFSIEAKSVREAKPRLERIETDILNNFKVLGVKAYPLNGVERLQIMYETFHQEEQQKFDFSYDRILQSGMTTKDFIAPTSFLFKSGKDFMMGDTYGAASYLNILAPELTDKVLAEFLDMDKNLVVSIHVQSVDQLKAIKLIKGKITDLDRMKIEEQKKAVRSGYDMEIIPSDLATYGGEAKKILDDLQSRNERMFLVTVLFLNTAKTKQELDSAVFQTAGIAQKFNCTLNRLDYLQEQGLMSSLPLANNLVPIKRALTTTSTAIFVPFTTQELFMEGDSLYYGLNAVSNNMIMADRKQLKNPKGLYHKGTGTPRKTQATAPFAAQMGRQPQERSGNKSDPRMPYWIVEKNKKKDFENSSVLPPVFLLLVRGSNLILPISDYPPKNQERSFTVFYINHSHNSTWKGANPMKSDNKSKANNNEGGRFSRRIGSTTYLVSVHFSKTSKETFEDKMMRFVESEVQKTA